MRLYEITGMVSDDELKRLLASPGTIDVLDASGHFSRDNISDENVRGDASISLGTLERVGAGKIDRRSHLNGVRGRWLGFQYFKELPDATPILAKIRLHTGRVMNPGDHFIEEG